jgi:DNA-binding winged helix-turn-helix (wHTH) protein
VVQRADPAPRSANGLIVEPFFAERDGRRCDLGNTMSHKLVTFLYPRPNEFVSVADVGEGVWGDDMVETETIKKTARNTNAKLKADKIRDVYIDTSQRDYLQLVVT